MKMKYWIYLRGKLVEIMLWVVYFKYNFRVEKVLINKASASQPVPNGGTRNLPDRTQNNANSSDYHR